MGLNRGINLVLGKFLAGEIPLHIFFAGLRHGLDQGVADNSQVLLRIFRDLAFLIIAEIRKSAARHLYYVYEADKFLIFTDRHLERRDLSSEPLLHL